MTAIYINPDDVHDRGLTVVANPPTPAIDHQAARTAVRELLAALGQDIHDPELAETPRRVVASFEELLAPAPFRLTTFANNEGYDELVIVRDIPVQSLCAHHLLPFTGVAHVAYLPDERILGLSKLARAVEMFARGLQVQERLTSQVGAWLNESLRPKGVGVVIEAEHLCMSLRGVQARGARTVTSSLHGLVRDDARTRAEFLALAGHRS
ncbi:MAG: GTP cyclohydrolase I FolE [Microthrixaceae bacterium]